MDVVSSIGNSSEVADCCRRRGPILSTPNDPLLIDATVNKGLASFASKFDLEEHSSPLPLKFIAFSDLDSLDTAAIRFPLHWILWWKRNPLQNPVRDAEVHSISSLASLAR
ncbi:hypothetical protein R1flu_000162 [Riccia fluitans]|uniref:Uncharacterized protein n=1 Tax=Riccia fluitans TaxID=41844 RepID=A0ABD1Y2N2_9MARC